MFISQDVRFITPNEEMIQLDYSIDSKDIISKKNQSVSIRVQKLYTSVSSHFK